MPRIFHVTFTREFDVTILAEDEKELRAALKEQEHEIEDWTDVDWDFSVTDPLRGKKPDKIPTEFTEPDMGVLAGECVHISDYMEKFPDYLDKVKAEASEVARRLTLDKVNLKLFPED